MVTDILSSNHSFIMCTFINVLSL